MVGQKINNAVVKISACIRKFFGSLKTATIVITILLSTFCAVSSGVLHRDFTHTASTIPSIAPVIWLSAISVDLLFLANIALIFGAITNKEDFLYGWLSLNILAVPVNMLLIFWAPIVQFHLPFKNPYNTASLLVGLIVILSIILFLMILVYGLALEIKYGPPPNDTAIYSPNGWMVPNVAHEVQSTNNAPVLRISADTDDSAVYNPKSIP